jgi:hypothetical protein
MSSKVKGFTVIFKDSISEEKFETIKNVMMLFEDVIEVMPSVVIESDWIDRQQALYEFKQAMFKTLKDM